jgi:hypothetical protein
MIKLHLVFGFRKSQPSQSVQLLVYYKVFIIRIFIPILDLKESARRLIIL